MKRLRLREAQKVSIAQRHQGLLSLLLKEVQETLKGLRIRLVQPGRSTGEFFGYRPGHRGAGRVVETAEGEEEGSQQHSRHISIARTRGQERSSVWLSASKMHFLPQAKESPLHKGLKRLCYRLRYSIQTATKMHQGVLQYLL